MFQPSSRLQPMEPPEDTQEDSPKSDSPPKGSRRSRDSARRKKRAGEEVQNQGGDAQVSLIDFEEEDPSHGYADTEEEKLQSLDDLVGGAPSAEKNAPEIVSHDVVQETPEIASHDVVQETPEIVSHDVVQETPEIVSHDVCVDGQEIVSPTSTELTPSPANEIHMADTCTSRTSEEPLDSISESMKKKRLRRKSSESDTGGVFESSPKGNQADALARTDSAVSSFASQQEIKYVFESAPQASKANVKAGDEEGSRPAERFVFESRPSESQAQFRSGADVQVAANQGVFESTPQASKAEFQSNVEVKSVANLRSVFESTPAVSKASMRSGAASDGKNVAPTDNCSVFESKPATSKAAFQANKETSSAPDGRSVFENAVVAGKADVRACDKEAPVQPLDRSVFENIPDECHAQFRHGESDEFEYETDDEANS